MKNEQNKWRSRKKLVDAAKVLKQPKELKVFRYNESNDNEKRLKYKETFDELSNERIGELHNLSKQIYEVQCIFIII